ncbi:MAG: hypothetical protein PHY95_02155, partial [Candidatus ainarchaeum sp.]|nr:hypothetical protein [Candidatus ainarchaeum sp.]
MVAFADGAAEVLDARIFRLGERFEHAGFLALCFLSFMVPFLLGHPQLLVGIAVNAFLVLAALNMDSKKVVPLALLPSIGAIARGVLFGPFTFALVYMVPFIWAGNMALIFAMKFLFAGRKTDYLISLGAGSLVKAGFLFSAAYAMLQFSLVPALFLEA